MEYLVTAQEMKAYDAEAIERIGIPSMVLMERAALSAWEEIRKRFPAGGAPGDGAWRILILAGCGNNGADGLALARMLAEQGDQVEVVCCGKEEKATREWKNQRSILENYSVRIGSKPEGGEYNILIDALFGVGLTREVTGEYAEIIGWINSLRGYKVALDIPSGIHSDHGKIMGCAVKADLTVSFAFCKRGLVFYPGAEYAGEIAVRDIGIGEGCFGGSAPEMFRFTEKAQELLPYRSPQGNKGTFGKVLLVAGSRNMAGAAVLAARGSYCAGAGMVKIISQECNRDILQTSVPEALLGDVQGLEQGLQWALVAAAGPGLGTSSEAAAALEKVLEESRLPLVLDADALNLLAADSRLQDRLAAQAREGREVILTPHIGELSRLTGRSIQEVKDNSLECTKSLAERLNCVIVSKDARTLICRSGGLVCVNTTGNSGMAVAGSGDVLTGIIAGLLAQGMDCFRAAAVGVYLHGCAGDAAAARYGEHGLAAGDIAEALRSRELTQILN